MPFAGIARAGGEQRCLRSRFKLEGLGDGFPVTRVSPLMMGFGVVPNNNGTDVHQNNWAPGQPYCSEEMEFECLLHTKSFATVQAWVKECLEGKGNVTRKTLTYHILHPQQDTNVLSFNLEECFPTDLDILASNVDGGGDVGRYLLKVRVHKITVQ